MKPKKLKLIILMLFLSTSLFDCIVNNKKQFYANDGMMNNNDVHFINPEYHNVNRNNIDPMRYQSNDDNNRSLEETVQNKPMEENIEDSRESMSIKNTNSQEEMDQNQNNKQEQNTLDESGIKSENEEEIMKRPEIVEKKKKNNENEKIKLKKSEMDEFSKSSGETNESKSGRSVNESGKLYKEDHKKENFDLNDQNAQTSLKIIIPIV